MEQNNYQEALEQPIHSGFNVTSTASDVINGIELAGNVAIVTGGNEGTGLETTKVLAAAGATVIVLARNTEKAKKNLQGIANVELETVDLMDPVYIDGFAYKFLASGRSIHLLINNAGIIWVPLRRNSRGIESKNHWNGRTTSSLKKVKNSLMFVTKWVLKTSHTFPMCLKSILVMHRQNCWSKEPVNSQ